MGRRTILDVDTGNDDAVAIILAALHPAIDVLGVTTVSGNIDVEFTTDNTLRVLDYINRQDIPVYKGLGRPFTPRPFARPSQVASTGAQAHQLHLDLPEPTMSAQSATAVEWLVETLRTATEQITLIPVAPLTNIAAAVTIAPEIVHAVDEVIIMGGASGRGNESSQAEFNVHEDPLAAQVVLSAGFEKVTMIPLDATRQALLSVNECAKMRDSGTKAAMATAGIVESYIAARQGQPWAIEKDSAPIHDALCVAYAINPASVETTFLPVSVDTTGFHTFGRTIVDPFGRDGRDANVWWAHSTNLRVFNDVLFEALSY